MEQIFREYITGITKLGEVFTGRVKFSLYSKIFETKNYDEYLILLGWYLTPENSNEVQAVFALHSIDLEKNRKKYFDDFEKARENCKAKTPTPKSFIYVGMFDDGEERSISSVS